MPPAGRMARPFLCLYIVFGLTIVKLHNPAISPHLSKQLLTEEYHL